MKSVSGEKNAASEATSIEEIERSFAVVSAKDSLVVEAFNMGWRLAISVLVPVFIGVKLDDHFKSSPSYTLTALFIAAFAAGMTVYKTSTSVNRREMAKSTVKRKSRNAK